MARLSDKIDQLQKKGKDGDTLTDPTVKGLAYQKQGDRLYARLRVVNKATGKRQHHALGPLPTALEMALKAKFESRNLSFVWERSLEEFRAKARSLRLNAREGIAGTAPVRGKTVNELWETYEKIELGRLSEKTAKQSRQYAKRFLLPALGTRPVAKVTKQEVAELHAGLAPTPYQANRVLSLIRTVFGKGVEWSWTSANPASGIKPFQEHHKEDWYTPEELGRLITALEANPNKVQSRAILLMLYTGARVGEVLKATWDQFDLEEGTWTKPASGTKQKRVHHLGLNEDAIALLTAMRSECEGKGFVFASPFVPGSPLKDVERTWDRGVKDAGVRRLRLYDLRHSVASVLASSGVDLYVIGKQLGHSQAKTSARYAHLSVDAQREASRKFGELVRRAPTKGRKKG